MSPIAIDLKDCKLVGFEQDEVLPLLKELELNKAIRSIKKLQLKLGGEAEIKQIEVAPTGNVNNSNGQLSLFGDRPTEETEPEPTVELFKPKLNTRIIDTEEKLSELVEILEQHS